MSFISSEYEEREYRIYTKIKEKTGLKEEFLLFYKLFNDEATFSDGIIMPEKAKRSLKELMKNIDEQNIKGKTSEKIYNDAINELYNLALTLFEKKDLIEYIKIGYKHIYPKIKGYNYINDPEFYIAYRTKNSKKWNGRISTPITLFDVVSFMNYGYEFREKDITNCFFN